MREAGPLKRQPKILKAKLTQGDHEARVYSDQMVLVIVRLEAAPHERQSKTLKGELENNSRNPRDLIGKLA